MQISKRNYGDYSSNNYGAHTQQVDIGNLRLWFSYDTVVAFHDNDGRKVCENCWQQTTGKHLNWIDGGDKKSRLPYDEFNELLNEALARHELIIS